MKYSVREIVKDVLYNNQETRDNDTLLYLKCCEKLGATSLNDLYRIDLNIISVHKARQTIQNKYGLFKPSEEVLHHRHLDR